MDGSVFVALGVALFLLVIVFALGKWIVNWLYEIEKRNRYMEAELRLLSHIALKQGVDNEEVQDILTEADLPYMKIKVKKGKLKG